MTTNRKRKGKWFVEIRKKHFKHIRKTFVYEIDARKCRTLYQSKEDLPMLPLIL